MKKVGIMGGTFDPIHIGHLILGERACEQLCLDEIVYMPAGNPPHKRLRPGRATNEERYRMTELAISGNPRFRISDFEMRKTGPSFTYQTLESLTALHPDTAYTFLIGADSLFDFDTWREPQRICDRCTLAVAVRDHAPDARIDARIEEIRRRYHAVVRRLDTGNIDVSSSQIREWVREGRSIRYYVPEAVIAYMEEEGIYKHHV